VEGYLFVNGTVLFLEAKFDRYYLLVVYLLFEADLQFLAKVNLSKRSFLIVLTFLTKFLLL
jgi:hypothetical protein